MSGLPSAPEIITRALAPGVALTALVLYNTSLQNRFVYITGRIRELNREVRQLRAVSEPSAGAEERIESLRRQVTLMRDRSCMVRRAVLLVYSCFGCFMMTIFSLSGSMFWPPLDRLALVFFAGGFAVLGIAAVHSAIEMFLAMRTVQEDIHSSFQ